MSDTLKTGPIVRINPDELHVKDPNYYDEIYAGGNKRRDKYSAWIHMAGAPRAAFSTVEHDLHKTRRAALNPFFAKRSVFRLEPRIQDKVDRLCARLSEFADSGQVVRLDVAYMALTMDVITEYAYGTCYNYLSEPDFKLEWKECMATVFEGAAFRRATPWLTQFFQLFPERYVLSMMPKLEVLIKWQHDIKDQVGAILSHEQSSTSDDTIFHSLRDSDTLAEDEKSLARLADEGEILIAAGSETTARTLTYTTFRVFNTPGVLTRLREELKTVMPHPTSTAKWSDLEQLPYLSAVVSEGLRLGYGITTRLPRLAKEPLHYGKFVVPPDVSCASPVFACWPED
jgi:cytochrome P450